MGPEGETRAVSRLPSLSLTQFVVIVAALVVGYLLFAAAGDVLRTHRLNRHEQRLRQEIAELQRQHEKLEALRTYLQTDEYIAGVARRVLGLVRPGETLVIVSSSATPEPTPEQTPTDDEGPWWEALYDP